MVADVVVVTEVVVKVVVVDGVVLDREGFQISKIQKLGSVIGADSAPTHKDQNHV